jgi:transcriptional regulator with XRE-family HTH domain
VIDAPPARRLLLGTALRQYREGLGYLLDDAARVLDCDRSKISRIETGHRGIRRRELRELLTEYGVSDQAQNALAVLAQAGCRDGWWLQYASVIPEPYQEYLALEQAASQILIYDPQHLPALLCTPDYARATATAEPADAAQQALARLTLTRQQALARHQPRLTALIGETALRQATADAEITRNQLKGLAATGQATIQILPAGPGTPSSGPATILRFAGLAGLGAVYLPALSGGICLTGQHDVATYTTAFERLRAAALTPAASAELILEMAGRTDGA